MKGTKWKGKRIRPGDRNLVTKTAVSALLPAFLLALSLFYFRQLRPVKNLREMLSGFQI